MTDKETPEENEDSDVGSLLPMPEEILEEIPSEMFDGIPPEKREELIRTIVGVALVHEQYSGPIPHPRIVRQYEEILPGSADRILAMAERQQSHRHEIERTVIFSDKKLEAWGLVGGFILALILIIGGIFLIDNDKDITGLIVIGTGALGLARAYQVERQRRDTERQSKRRNLDKDSRPYPKELESGNSTKSSPSDQEKSDTSSPS